MANPSHTHTTGVPTFTATIWVGLRRRYDAHLYTLDDVREVCRREVDRQGWCVTITPTEYVYTNGSEPGAAIGVINYPRFPSDIDGLEARTLYLAERLKTALEQLRVSVVFPDRTVMLGDDQ